jgi:hypothetical protein
VCRTHTPGDGQRERSAWQLHHSTAKPPAQIVGGFSFERILNFNSRKKKQPNGNNDYFHWENVANQGED